MASKIIVVGAIEGQIQPVFSKISALHTKNAFALGLVIGNLFADPSTATPEDETTVQDLIYGKISIPLPMYFALGSHGLPQPVIDKIESSAGEVCENLFFLGKRTTNKTSEGIKIVALGGILDPNILGTSTDKYSPFYNETDAKVLKGANSADILVTSQWPAGIRIGSKVSPSPGDVPPEHQCLSGLCSTIKPRYHFSTSSVFFEREPFFHAPSESAPDAFCVTRFISLAPFGNPSKQKWIYAFTIDPTAAPPISISTGTTASPFTITSAQSSQKRSALPDQNTYRFSAGDSNGHYASNRRPNKRRRHDNAGPREPSECFFCLSSPTLATHLITSIGTDAYLTIAKGPLSASSTFPSLGFPCHILIIPLAHSPTLASISDVSARRSTYEEMQRYRSALQKMLAEKAAGKLGAVTWEVSRAGGVHTHWQFLPIASEMVRKGLVEAAFKVEAENVKYPAFVNKDVGDGAGEEDDFFRVLIWAPKEEGREAEETALTLPLDPSFRFDLQFGRRVLAKLLGLESRTHWMDCGQEEAEETKDVDSFKEAFKGYDFSLEE
ncbi:hypothetical protein K402DRAFT_386912 [Aulographum hederae CBS 113979]|uniref:CwfJ domain-containing protein n=1 Tax=Aulographum hederae CBS 113979 TaxID=1176131 RepID=A0A6G1GKF3_9PEZI|nr:hypothetical protein K402DRAFT_386912 [Aulographum hederae CBS 113979]